MTDQTAELTCNLVINVMAWFLFVQQKMFNSYNTLWGKSFGHTDADTIDSSSLQQRLRSNGIAHAQVRQAWSLL